MDEAVKLYKQMEEYVIPLDSLSASYFVTGYGKRRLYHRAETIYDSFRAQYPNDVGIPLYNAILPIYIKQNKYDEAIQAYKEMQKNIPIYRMRYTKESTLAISSLLASQRNFRALKMFYEELPEAGFVLANEHFAAAIYAFRYVKAQREIFQLLEFAESVVGKKGCQVDVEVVHYKILESCINPPCAKTAELFLERLKPYYVNKKDDVPLHSIYAVVQLHAGNEKAALHVLKHHMLKVKERVPKRAAKEFFEYFLRKREFGKASRILREFEKSFKNHEELNQCRYKLMCVSGKLEEAVGMFYTFAKDGQMPSLTNCNLMLEAYIEAKRFDEGEALFNEMQENNLNINLRTYESVLKIVLESRGMESFESILSQVREQYSDKPLTIRISSMAIDAALRSNNIATAKELVLDILEKRESEIDSNFVSLALLYIAKDTTVKKDLYEDLWRIVKRYRIPLSITQLVEFLDAIAPLSWNHINKEIFGLIIDYLKKPNTTIDRSFCSLVRNSLINTRYLTQASKYWSLFLKYSTQSHKIVDEDEKQIFANSVADLVKSHN